MRVLFTIGIAVSLASALAQDPNPEKVEAATYRALCGTRCHTTALVEGLRTEEEWREEVDQMIKVGARGTEEQFQRLMRYLARTMTKVNVNTAEARQIAPVLDVSDGVAEAVVKWRAEKGEFKTLEDL